MVRHKGWVLIFLFVIKLSKIFSLIWMWNILMAGLLEEAFDQSRTQVRVPPCCRHAENLQVVTGQRERQRKGVIDVIADVRVDDYLFWCRGSGRRDLP